MKIGLKPPLSKVNDKFTYLFNFVYVICKYLVNFNLGTSLILKISSYFW